MQVTMLFERGIRRGRTLFQSGQPRLTPPSVRLRAQNDATARYAPQRTPIRLNAKWLAIGLLALLTSGCAVQPPQQMAQSLSAQITAAGFSADQVALVVMPVHSNSHADAPRHGLHHNADALMQPASTLKLVTSAVALDVLGAVWRGETTLLTHPADLDQARHDGVLRQPLYVRGQGDPDLDYAALNVLLSQLYSAGVRELRGGIVLDRSWFSPELPNPHAAPFDESPRARYNYIPDALGLEQQMLALQLRSDASTVVASTMPTFSQLKVESALTLTAGRCDAFNADLLQIEEKTAADGQVVLRLTGEFPRNCSITEPAAWLSRDAQWRLSLTQFWRQLGGSFGPSFIPSRHISHGITPANTIVVAQHFSRPLPQLLQQVNKNSDNGVARILALQLGRLATTGNTAPSDTVKAADAVVSQWLSARQVPVSGMMLDNGSGLSRQARISATQLATLLQLAWQQPWGLDLASSLPRAGVDGTLQNRLTNSVAQDRARLKTGTLRNGTGLAGYVFDRQNRPWIFVGLVNAEQSVAKGRALLDLWVQQVSQF